MSLLSLDQIKTLYDDLRGRIEDGGSVINFLPVDNASGSIASFPDGADDIPVKSLIAQITPLQDLHGYDNPWPAGGNVNKFDKSTANLEYKLDATGGLAANSSRFVSDYIPVTANSDYYLTKVSGSSSGYCCAVYDNSKGFLRNVSVGGGAGSSGTVNVGADAAYVRVEGALTDIDASMLSVGTTAPDKYYSYSNICPISGWTGAKISNVSGNVHDTTTDIVGYIYDANLDYVASESTRLTDFIPVGDASKIRYYISALLAAATVRVTWFNASKTPISQTANTHTTSSAHNYQYVDVPSGAVYFRISGHKDNITITYINTISVLNIHFGINQWDEAWEVGSYSTLGAKIADSTRIRSANKIPVKPSTAYFMAAPTGTRYRWFEYDINGDFVAYHDFESGNFSVGATTYYITFIMATTYGTTYNNNVSINYPATVTEYTPSRVVYGGTLTYIGVGKYSLQANKASVELGTLNWTHAAIGTYGYWYATLSTIKSSTVNILSEIYKAVSAAVLNGSETYKNCMAVNGTSVLVNDGSTSIAPTGQFVYELATFPDPIILDAEDVKTLLGDNNIFADTGDVSVDYRADIALYIQKVVNA